MYEFSDNIQRGIIYLLKNNKDFFVQIASLVKPDYFEFPVHENIYKIVNEHYDKYQTLPTDEMIIEHAKGKKRERESLSDYEDELHVINRLDASSIDNTDYYLDLVETFARREAMKQAIKESLSLIKEDRMDETEQLIRGALMVSRQVDVGQKYFDDIGDRWERMFNQEKKEKFKTILPSLDKSLEGGLGAKELAMVVAPPGVGKSLWLVNQSVRSMIDGKKVLYISLEMSEDKIAQRFDSVMSMVSQRQIKDPGSQLKIKERLKMFQDNFPGSRLIIKEFPTGTATVNTLRSLLVQLRNYEDFQPDVIFIDYLELMRPVRENQHEYQAQQRIAEEIRGVAMEANLLIWTATQTNRLGRAVRVITDAELGDSYGKIRTCDFALSLNQTDEEFDEGLMRAYVIKSRNGRPRFIVPMKIDYGTLRMEETEAFETEDADL